MEISGGWVVIFVLNFVVYLFGIDVEIWIRENVMFDVDEMLIVDVQVFQDFVFEDVVDVYECQFFDLCDVDVDCIFDQQVYDGFYLQFCEVGWIFEVVDKEVCVVLVFFWFMVDRIGEDLLDLVQCFGVQVCGFGD